MAVRLLSLSTILLSGIWLYVDRTYEPAVTFLAGVAGLLASWGDRSPKTETKEVAQARRNRQAMLAKVRKIWITDFLDQSLDKEARIALGLAERPEAVLRALNLIGQLPDQPNRRLPPNTQMIEVFDEQAGQVLILGAPGAGKTTLLLELTRDLLDRAIQNPEDPTPVVFPLSSWAAQRRPLVDWLVDELNQRYDVPRKTAQAWVETDQILPLLDGLDEVAQEYRAACVEAINDFRQDPRGLLPLVVCCRVADYETIGQPLRLHGAVVVQPLTHEQVNTYLRQIGDPLASIRRVLHEDPILWDLLDTPLLLTIVTLAYADQPLVDLQAGGSVEARRYHLFAAYIERMFHHRNATTQYPRTQTLHWLTWLARQMVEHGQTVFYIERLQPTWLPRAQQRVMRGTALSLLLIFALSGTLLVGLSFGLGGGLSLGLSGGLGLGLSAAQIYAMGVGLVYRLSNGLIAGLLFGLSGALLFGLRYMLPKKWRAVPLEIVHPIETVRWSWSDFFFRLPRRLGAGLGGGLILGLILGLGGTQSLTQSLALTLGPSLALIFGLTGGLSGGEIETKNFRTKVSGVLLGMP